ncbi:MAG: QueT transporter family protein [Actinomycetes bacterium]|jgi:uncharacterized membrane protein|nr:QueT transporter family protein [Actinomycetes bacterium]
MSSKALTEVKTRSVSAVARGGIIAAAYAALTLAMAQIPFLSWNLVQFRISEALVILPLFFAEAVPGLAVGCLVANLVNIALTGSGVWGLLDVVFGTIATLVGGLWTRKFRHRPLLALAGPVVANALIVAAYMPAILKGLGLYTVPFTNISLETSWIWMYLFGAVSVGLGEALVVYVIGYPLYRFLRRYLSDQPVTPAQQ